MANLITFTILTDAPYSEAELVGLKESFLDFMTGIDDETVVGSQTIEIVDEDNIPDEDDKKRAIVEEFLGEAKVEFQIQARIHPDSGEIFLGKTSAFLEPKV